MARKLDQRSRALRRNLRKQARKGTLSSREKKDLLTQEGRFRKAARRRRPFTLGLPLLAGVGAGVGALQGGLALGDMLAGMRREKPPKGDPEQTPKVNANGEVVVDPAAPVTDPAAPVAGDGADMVPNRSTMEEYERIRAQEAADSALVDEEGNNLNPRLDKGYDVEKEDVPPPVVGGPGTLPPEAQERLRRRNAREQRNRQAAVDAAVERGLDRQEVESEVTPLDYQMDPAIFRSYDDYLTLEDGNRTTPSANALRSDAETGEVMGGIYSSADLDVLNPSGVGNFHVDRLTSPTLPSEHVPLVTGADRASNPNQRSYVRDALADLAGRSLDDPRIESLRRLDPVPLDEYVLPPGEGTPTSQGRDAQQQAQNEIARLRSDDLIARGREYNELMRRIRDNANTIRPVEEFDMLEEDDIPLEFGDAYMPLIGIEEFDMPEEADIPLEDFPRSTRRERARMAREAARARNRARREGVDGIPVREAVGPRVQANGGKNPTAEKLMQRIRAKYGMK